MSPSSALPPGVHPLGRGQARDGLLLIPPPVPASVAPSPAAPLVVTFHGAGSSGDRMVSLLAAAARHHGFVLLAPDSRSHTWDAVRGAYGPDVRFLREALEHAVAATTVDTRRLCLAGYSDGASYAASLGLAYGDVFQAVVAYSPGFVVRPERPRTPRFFVSHGSEDPVLPVDRCSRRLVPLLRRAGCDVTYQEFPGGHDVPAEVIDASMAWLWDTPTGRVQ